MLFIAICFINIIGTITNTDRITELYFNSLHTSYIIENQSKNNLKHDTTRSKIDYEANLINALMAPHLKLFISVVSCGKR